LRAPRTSQAAIFEFSQVLSTEAHASGASNVSVKGSSPHIRAAYDFAKIATSTWLSSLEIMERSREMAEQSRLLLKRSDKFLEWCEEFGPRPYTSERAPSQQSEADLRRAEEKSAADA
jgi:hypothetical protein